MPGSVQHFPATRKAPLDAPTWYSPAVAYRIKTVAARTGVRAETLRVWERRYGLVSPQRSETGYRLYSEDDIEILGRVKDWVDSGLSVGEAVSHARQTGLLAPRVEVAAASTGGALQAARTALVTSLLDLDSHRADAVLASQNECPFVMRCLPVFFMSELNSASSISNGLFISRDT